MSQCNCYERPGECDWCRLEAKNDRLGAQVKRLRDALTLAVHWMHDAGCLTSDDLADYRDTHAFALAVLKETE